MESDFMTRDGCWEAFIDQKKRADALESQLAEANARIPQWISVEERLPQTGALCLVVWGGHVQSVAYRRIGLGFACADGYEWLEAGCLEEEEYSPIPDGEITHWQPLLPPPASGAKEEGE